MLTYSRYALSGSPQVCAFCRRPFPTVDDRREAFHCRQTGEYFCDHRCARRFGEAAPADVDRRAA
jgi:hypothetical protein